MEPILTRPRQLRRTIQKILTPNKIA